MDDAINFSIRLDAAERIAISKGNELCMSFTFRLSFKKYCFEKVKQYSLEKVKQYSFRNVKQYSFRNVKQYSFENVRVLLSRFFKTVHVRKILGDDSTEFKPISYKEGTNGTYISHIHATNSWSSMLLYLNIKLNTNISNNTYSLY